jgi:hypothetical protein
MKTPITIVTRLIVALFIATSIEAINFWLVVSNFYSDNWFLALFFPLSVGMIAFGTTIYFLTSGIIWKRVLTTLFGGLALTFVWLFIFVMVTSKIMGWGTLITIKE